MSQSIAARFIEQVRRDPQRPAIWTSSGTWSYGELETLAVRVARALRQQAHAPQRVALLFDHGAPMLAAIMGTLLAGMTYVPLDTAHPQERLHAIIADAEATILLTERCQRSRAEELADLRLSLVEFESLPDPSWDSPRTPASPPGGVGLYSLYLRLYWTTEGGYADPSQCAASYLRVHG